MRPLKFWDFRKHSNILIIRLGCGSVISLDVRKSCMDTSIDVCNLHGISLMGNESRVRGNARANGR